MRENNRFVLSSCGFVKAFGQAHIPLGRVLTKKGHTLHHACPHSNTPVHMSSGPLSSYKGTIYDSYQYTIVSSYLICTTYLIVLSYHIVSSYLIGTSHLIVSSYLISHLSSHLISSYLITLSHILLSILFISSYLICVESDHELK